MTTAYSTPTTPSPVLENELYESLERTLNQLDSILLLSCEHRSFDWDRKFARYKSILLRGSFLHPWKHEYCRFVVCES